MLDAPPMRVLVHTHNWLPTRGGVATYCHAVAAALAGAGDEVRLLAPAAGPAPTGLPYGVAPLPARLSHERIRPLDYPGAARRLRRALRSWRPDVVLAAQADAVYLAALAGSGGAALALTIHGSEITRSFDGSGLVARVNRRLIRRALLRADAVVAVSAYTRGLLRSRVPELPAGRVTVVHHGVPEAGEPGGAERPAELDGAGGPWLLSVGRVEEGKGFHLVPPILARLRRRLPGVVWVLAGAGPLGAAVREAAAREGVLGHVRFLDFVPPERLRACYAAADLLLHPAVPDAGGRQESFGLVVAEAMAAGCPVAATRVGGVPEVVGEGEGGFFFDPRRPEEAAAAIGELLADRPRREAMGERARARARSAFSLGRMARETRAVLRAAVRRRQGRGAE